MKPQPWEPAVIDAMELQVAAAGNPRTLLETLEEAERESRLADDACAAAEERLIQADMLDSSRGCSWTQGESRACRLAQADFRGALLHKADREAWVSELRAMRDQADRSEGRKPAEEAAAHSTDVPAARPLPYLIRVGALYVCALPAVHRNRYSEDFREELFGLAAAGASRRQQWRYTFRLGIGLPSLRLALMTKRTKLSLKVSMGAAGVGGGGVWSVLAGWAGTVDIAVLVFALVGGAAYVVSSNARTERVVTLIREIRSGRNRKVKR